MKNLSILTVGTTSGIGEYIYKELGGHYLTRATLPEEIEELQARGVDIIIHCARNRNRVVNSEILYNYINDNVFDFKVVDFDSLVISDYVKKRRNSISLRAMSDFEIVDLTVRLE